ncbi:MAG TPA: helicase C-terminal domain-containing protein [Spirochaetales bacterium]|nr:helicase C-terminal domain-containing protein [Spirochaetales bacterium]HQK34405.1 helicase C-terminal domain-containing protein [Spirochaetales bacterium]HRV28295.1 helicase C-terminal domain-containing protein [Spirochaetia bacterium]
MKTSERFCHEAILDLRDAITDACGNEIYAAGMLDEDGKVASVAVLARGSIDSVLVHWKGTRGTDVLIHNHPSGNLSPSKADMRIAEQFAEEGYGFYIINNTATEVYVVIEPVVAKEAEPIDSASIVKALEPGGKLAKKLPNYEHRPDQLKLIQAVSEAFNHEQILIAEAGTGIGKSFAYLLPAVYWALQNKQRVVVSTATINLQQQLYEKDMPLIASLFNEDVKYVLMKGRGNYICRKRVAEYLEEEGLFAHDNTSLQEILAWMETTTTGDRNDMVPYPEESLWSKVCSESESCSNIRCPYHDQCFFIKNRKEASAAHIIITNHHLLLIDCANRGLKSDYSAGSVLPPFENIILDEAHNLEQSASSAFSEAVNRFRLNKFLTRIQRERNEKKFGVLPGLQNEKMITPALRKKISGLISDIQFAFTETENHAFALIGNENTLLFDASLNCKEFLDSAMRCGTLITELITELAKAKEKLEIKKPDHELISEINNLLLYLEEYANLFYSYSQYSEDEKNIYWIQKQRTLKNEYYITFIKTPLTVDSCMQAWVFEPYKSIVLISATLSTGGSFNYIKSRLGLYHNERVQDAQFFSPFPYEDTALLAIPEDAPDNSQKNWQNYINTTVYKLIIASHGSALVLFTSYDSLQATWKYAEPLLKQDGIPAYCQGSDSRSRLLEIFKSNITSVLFATDSFWEGVDAPGETLKHLIIVKLPFRHPNDPIFLARSKHLEKKNKNPFMELSLPDAVIRFKQGFGRLIRHSSDTGVVTVLDSRIIKKSYGEIFLKSLPRTQKAISTTDRLIPKIKDFFGVNS